MFNFFKAKATLWGTLSIRDNKKIDSYVALLTTDWTKIEQLLKNMGDGKIANLNFQASDSDGINLDRNINGNFTLSFFPRVFLKGEDSPYYELTDNNQNLIPMETAKKAIEYFFNNQKMDGSLNWKTKE